MLNHSANIESTQLWVACKKPENYNKATDTSPTCSRDSAYQQYCHSLTCKNVQSEGGGQGNLFIDFHVHMNMGLILELIVVLKHIVFESRFDIDYSMFKNNVYEYSEKMIRKKKSPGPFLHSKIYSDTFNCFKIFQNSL